MINIMKCKNCGSQNGVVDLHNGFYQCVACGAWIKKEGTGGNTACSIGYDHINNFDFTKAETTFDGILREDPCSRDALWGKLLARFGIVFLRGYGEAVSKPTFCFSKEDIGTARFTDQKEYKTLMELSGNDADSREIYQKKAKEIDNQLSDIKGDLAKKCDYDVFICVKIGTAVDDNAPHTNQRTKDYEIAREIYNDLTAKGLKVFCSEISRRGQIEYDKEIWSAMLRSRKILVIGTRRDYLMSCWVRSEWKRWIYLIERGKRSRDTFVSYIPDDNWQDIRPLEWDTYRINIWKKEDYRKMIKQLCEGDSVAKQTSASGTSDTFEDMVKNLRGLIIAGDWEEAEKALSKIPDNIKGRAEIQLLKIRYESLNFTEHDKIDHDKWNHVLTVAKKEKLNLKKNFEVIDYNKALKAWKKDESKRKKIENNNRLAAEKVQRTKEKNYLNEKRAAHKKAKENLRGHLSVKPIVITIVIILILATGVGAFFMFNNGEAVCIFHNWDSGVTTLAPTHTAKGSLTYTCTKCGKTKTKELAALPEHTWDEGKITKEPTTAEAGIKTYTCIECGAATTEEIAALCRHIWDEGKITKEPTTTETGIKTYTCFVCGETKTEELSALCEHTWNEGKITKEPTTTETGIKTYTCTKCGETKTETMEKLIGGSCGENLIWIFDEKNGILTVSGIGAMDDFGQESICGYLYKSEITKIVLENGVTNIGNAAFAELSNLTDVVIPDSVTIIGESAFENCNRLESVTIPSSVKSIGQKAFYSCKNLLNITIPGSVKSIGDYAFYWCKNLATVTIQNGVESIGVFAFSFCDRLEGVTIPSSVKNIGQKAFYSCNNLTTVTIQNGVESIGDSAFWGCDNLLNITIPDSVKNIGDSAFNSCNNLATVTIQNGVESIGVAAFSECENLLNITIPDSVTNIGASAFSRCDSLMSVVIGRSVTEIGNDAFFSCDRLTEIYNRSALNITIGKGDNGEIGYYAKAVYTEPYKSRLMTDADGFVKYVYDGKVWLINYLGKDSDITVPADVTHINRYAFYKKTIKSVSLGENIVSIDFYSFGYCDLLESIKIPKNVEKINDFSFSNCTALKAISVDSANKKFSSLDGNLYSKDKKTFILYAPGKKDSSFVIPDGVTAIGTGAFYGHYELKSVTIPNGVTRIGGYAFEFCSSITSIILPDSVTTIDRSAFEFCSSITSVTIPDSVTKIDEWAFKYCSSLTSITIPANVSYIGEDAFSGCDKLTSVTFKNTNGWSAGSDPVNSYVLFDPAKAAELLKKGYVWTRTAQ